MVYNIMDSGVSSHTRAQGELEVSGFNVIVEDGRQKFACEEHEANIQTLRNLILHVPNRPSTFDPVMKIWYPKRLCMPRATPPD
jgi:hypothetical protein